jgi:hypothetical protein
MTTKEQPFWYQLVDSDGKPFKGVDADIVLLPLDKSFVGHFRKQVRSDNSNKLSSVDAVDLMVFKNMAAFVASKKREEAQPKETRLDPTLDMDATWGSKKDMLVVEVPTPAPSVPATADEVKSKKIECCFYHSKGSIVKKLDALRITDVLSIVNANELGELH